MVFDSELPLWGLPGFPRAQIFYLHWVHLVWMLHVRGLFTLCIVCGIVHRTHCARFVPGSFANPPAGLPVLNPPLPCWWTRLHCWSYDGTQWTSRPVVRWSTVEDRVCPWFSSPIELAVMLARHVPHSQEGINHICLKPTPKWSHGSHKRFNVGQQMYNAVGREAKYFRFG